MNQHIHDKIQVLTVTDKQTSADKLLDKPKKFLFVPCSIQNLMKNHKTSTFIASLAKFHW